MVMAPIPIVSLPPRASIMELTILDVPLAKVYAVGMVFAVIPDMVVTMPAIVIAGTIPVVVADYHFLGSASPGCYRGYESRTQEKKTQISISSMHIVLRKSRTPMLESWLATSMHGGSSGVCAIQDTSTGACLMEGPFALASRDDRETAYPKTDRPPLPTSA
jgi:hypothetical protein